MLRQIEASLRTNTGWLKALTKVPSRPALAKASVRTADDLAQISLSEINALAVVIFVKERQSQVVVLPK